MLLEHGVIQKARDRAFFIVKLHFIIEMIWWTGLEPWEFESPIPGSLTSTFLEGVLGGPQPTGPNPLHHRDDLLHRPRAMGVQVLCSR